MKTQNPWKTIKQNTIYDNSWIQVQHHEVLNPSGKPGIYGTVHFKHLAIGIIPIDTDGYTYLVGQYRYPLKKYSWEIPEGGGDLKNNPILDAKRELKEETGLEAKKWTELLRINTSNSVTDELGIIYLAEDLELFQSSPDEDEDLVIKKIHFEEAFAMVMNGEILDSLSIAAILKVKVLLFS